MVASRNSQALAQRSDSDLGLSQSIFLLRRPRCAAVEAIAVRRGDVDACELF